MTCFTRWFLASRCTWAAIVVVVLVGERWWCVCVLCLPLPLRFCGAASSGMSWSNSTCCSICFLLRSVSCLLFSAAAALPHGSSLLRFCSLEPVQLLIVFFSRVVFVLVRGVRAPRPSRPLACWGASAASSSASLFFLVCCCLMSRLFCSG